MKREQRFYYFKMPVSYYQMDNSDIKNEYKKSRTRENIIRTPFHKVILI